MNEIGKPHPENVESGETVRRAESRFGDKGKIIEAMLEGDAEVLGDIDDLIEGVSEHENEAKLARIKYINANMVQLVKVKSGENGELLCIFKPYDGESERAKLQDRIESYYPRECAAYLVSEHFGFDLVPPTVIREIGGKLGALQLFLSHDHYADYAVIFSIVKDDDESARLSQVEDFQTIAALDWIIANGDRNPRNIMFNTSKPDELFAIDHGVIMNSQTFAERALRGPARSLTWDNVADKSLEVEVPSSLLQALKSGLERKDELTKIMIERVDGPAGVKAEEIEAMWERVVLILEKGVFLSPKNYQTVTGRPMSDPELGSTN